MIGETAVEPTGAVLDLDALEAALPDLRVRYAAARPFPHIVLDDFLVPSFAGRAVDDFPALDPEAWINYLHVNERKYGNPDPATWNATFRTLADVLMSPRFVAFLGQLTGIDELIVDPSFEGGGLHESTTGGFLNIHADFTVHPQHRTWRRRVNLLLFFNPDWPPGYGGDLELWSTDMRRCERRIAPLANRVVIFNTDAHAFHGHPEPLACPPGEARRSLALYYFTEEVAPTVRSTEYRARPGDGSRAAVLIYLDKEALRAYDWLKRRFDLDDHLVSRLLRRLQRLRPGRKAAS